MRMQSPSLAHAIDAVANGRLYNLASLPVDPLYPHVMHYHVTAATGARSLGIVTADLGTNGNTTFTAMTTGADNA